MSNTIDSSNASHEVMTDKALQTSDVQPQDFPFIKSTESFGSKMGNELKKADNDFKFLEQKVEKFMHEHKTLPDLLQELHDLNGKNAKNITPEQKRDMQQLKECFDLLQDSSKLLAAAKIYINKLKTLMDQIANSHDGLLQVKFPKFDLKNVPKKDYQLILPKLPSFASESSTKTGTTTNAQTPQKIRS
ncbi:hypothetical protein SOPP22_09740 [Shewanella sp. OPT22]|nr:hypothetical protein SOPP22_09740 [Shewanella sp. OPT22]